MTFEKPGPELPPLSLTQLLLMHQTSWIWSDNVVTKRNPTAKNTKLSIVEVLGEPSEDGKWAKLHSEVSYRKVFFFFSSFLSAR